MAAETKPLLKYSSDEYSARATGLRGMWARGQNAGRMVTHLWARAVSVVRMREVFAEFLATFALVVCILCCRVGVQRMNERDIFMLYMQYVGLYIVM